MSWLKAKQMAHSEVLWNAHESPMPATWRDRDARATWPLGFQNSCLLSSWRAPALSFPAALVPKTTALLVVQLALLLPSTSPDRSGPPSPLPKGDLHGEGFESDSVFFQALSSNCLWPRLKQNVLCGFRDEVTPFFFCNILNGFSFGGINN